MDVKLQRMISRHHDAMCMVRLAFQIFFFILHVLFISYDNFFILYLWILSTGQRVFRKGDADLWWSPLWCISGMSFNASQFFFSFLSIFILLVWIIIFKSLFWVGQNCCFHCFFLYNFQVKTWLGIG